MTIPIPPTDALEEPTTCVRINELWIPVLLGALQHYLNPLQWENGRNAPYMVNPPAIWQGDATDNENAEQQILEIMAALMAGNCEEVVTIPPGTIAMYGGTVAPDGWLLCNGDSYLKADYPELAAVLGSAFDKTPGGDSFIVPFTGRSPLGLHFNPPFDTIGELHGSLTHTLTISEMPQHSHSHAFRANATNFGGWEPALAANNAGFVGANSTGNTGGGQPHNNLHPVLVVNFIIKT